MLRCIAITVLCAFPAVSAFAQEFRGTITGRVTDSQAASIPNAKIVVTLINTGGRSQTSTGADGLYTVPFLAPGVYRLEAEASGFKRHVRDGIEVNAGDRVGIDIELALGQLNETITVTSEASMLDTTSATAGQVINSAQVENLPDERPHPARPRATCHGRRAQ